MIGSGMWIAIIELIVGLALLVGLYYWLKKRSKNASKSTKDNLQELLTASQRLLSNPKKHKSKAK